MLPAEIVREIEIRFVTGGKSLKIHSSSPLGGGCINEALRLETTSGRFFVKYNHAARYPGMFDAEAKGLQLIMDQDVINVPAVIFSGTAGMYSFLVLEYVEAAREVPDFWEDSGRSLAAFHRCSKSGFGLGHDNYIGSLPQSNKHHEEWIPFFTEERLLPQLRRAVDSGRMDKQDVRQAERLLSSLPSLLPVEKPSLLHGDLWSGNYMVGSNGRVCLIDPAVYYGMREMDIAMTRLFGGFPASFYEAYDHEFPMEKGWEHRLDLHNLYPLLVHVNLFGGSYASTVRRIIGRF